ncbi:hypothetical protein IQ254_29735 [Nodosilinea sp. LEGE 07088]|uniref:hypothetical protein n=1 Tax=Nodosilinea sp. LEGE 07088 TaxID=2777968 RepID=UPI0018819054|nr:hypothetical protein [Nodosilinea sp. LEGE 07088]MBE9141325.1 hypothetical protein [Nodosilinea sp. LEGE 07088]
MKMSAVLSLTWQLPLLALGLGLWGWWLTAFAAPKALIALMTLLITYGLWTGWGGVVPVSAAIATAVAGLVALDILPAFWPDKMHYKYWAYTMLMLWAVSTAIAVLLAKTGQQLQRVKLPHRWGWQLATLVGLLLSLRGGAVAYQAQWPSWVPWGTL